MTYKSYNGEKLVDQTDDISEALENARIHAKETGRPIDTYKLMPEGRLKVAVTSFAPYDS